VPNGLGVCIRSADVDHRYGIGVGCGFSPAGIRVRPMLRRVLALVAVSMAFATSSSVCATAHAAPDIDAQLQEADRLAWLTDWASALPVYKAAEARARTSGTPSQLLYAKFGRQRGEMQIRALGDLSDELARDLARPIVVADRRLRLRGLTVKGDIDLEWDVQAALRDWQQVRQLAAELGEKGWENRAAGELGMIAFLKGNTGEAAKSVQQALETAKAIGDVGGELRYLSAIANGLLLAGYSQVALGYTDRALAFAAQHPETGFPFVAYSTKVLTLIELKQYDEAERFAKTAMTQAQTGDRRIKEIELGLMLSRIAESRKQPEQALAYLERARTAAVTGQVHRLLADAEEALAEAYRNRGDLDTAARHAAAAVAATTAAGSRFTLPIRIGIQAGISAAQGRVTTADRLYDQAADIVEGIMVNVPSRTAQMRLVGVMSQLYAGHFALAAGALNDPAKAYRIIERARGRALADILRVVPSSDPRPADDEQLRAVAALQLRLMRARTASDRQRLLDNLLEVEQRAATTLNSGAGARPSGLSRRGDARLAAVQRTLATTEVLLEFVLLDARSYCLAITTHGVELVPLPGKTRLETLSQRARAELQEGRGAQGTASRELYDALLAPVSAHWRNARRLFVVPDGQLHLLPFDTVIAANDQDADGLAIAVAPSARVLALLRTKGELATANHDRPLLAIGGVPYERMASPNASSGVPAGSVITGFFDAAMPAKLPTLPRAEAEVRMAANILGPSSAVLVGDAATETALKNEDLSRYQVIHLAAHGFADQKFPERAAIVLMSDPRAGEDGLLQPREIARYGLQARLVVLSACETAVGPTIGQEGVLNIARAFLVGGARSVMMTLWPVSDATSAALMRQFYEHLAKGDDVSESSRASKRAVLERFGPESVATIAAFQIVGDGAQRLGKPGTAMPTVGAR
jgi:CHAT domain-containing protein